MSTPVLHLLAGPNGAGKSTFVTRILQPSTHLPFINADEIAARRWPGREADHGYQASRAAASEREQMIAAGGSFISETVFSHPSKVDLLDHARNEGYLTHLHIILISEELAILRVRDRVRRGGHHVPEEKIRDRYARLWDLLALSIRTVDHAWVYDNELARAPFRMVAEYARGRSVARPAWPGWTPTALRNSS